jgi:anti-sigma-K factor RskA
VSADGHSRYEQDVGAYLLGALSDLERQAFETHLAACSTCEDECARLRPAADALPRSVTPVAPPPTLKRSLMEVVEGEARDRAGAPRQRSIGERLAGLLPSLPRVRPAAALATAAVLVAVGVAGGFGVAHLTSGGNDRTVSASIDKTRVPFASARLMLPKEGKDGGILSLHGMPSLASNRVYQVWVQQDGEVIPGPVFGVDREGMGAAAVPADLRHARAVMVTREPRGGARAPSEKPILVAKL